jgi:hypothetical protein
VLIAENILVEDSLTFVVSQPTSSASDSETITNAVADPLTDKVCRESGLCNVKTQLLSKFFTEVGYFGRKKMQLAFETAAFGLAVGKMSGLVDTNSGAHVLLRIG